MKKVIGWVLILLLFVVLFGSIAFLFGIIEAFIVFICWLISMALAYAAVKLIIE